MTSKKIITWDLGATKCAAALVHYDSNKHEFACVKKTSLKIRDCKSLHELAKTIEDELEIKMSSVSAICIGAAGQYNGEYLHLDKGYPYEMAFKALAQNENWAPFAIVHDYSPIVCATFTNYVDDANHVKRLNDAPLDPQGRRVALGIGTGVGLKDGVLLQNGDFWLGTNEVGHIGIATPPDADKIYRDRHNEFLHFLQSEDIVKSNAPLTFENILAGAGIVRIHSFFDRDAKDKSAEEIGELVRSGKAEETLALFAWYLGLLVGTVQLAFMPNGGIWLAGGVVLNHLELFAEKDFFIGIESSPAYLNLRKTFPLGVLHGSDHAFVGAAYYALKRVMGG